MKVPPPNQPGWRHIRFACTVFTDEWLNAQKPYDEWVKTLEPNNDSEKRFTRGSDLLDEWRRARQPYVVNFDSPLELEYYLNTKHPMETIESARAVAIKQFEHDDRFGWSCTKSIDLDPKQAYERYQFSKKAQHVVVAGGPTSSKPTNKRGLEEAETSQSKSVKLF